MKLDSYINSETPLLLQGRSGMPMLADALDLSKALLNTDNLEVHPDFLLVSSDKKTIGVDVVQGIVSMASRRSTVAKVSVCVIDGMEKLTIQAQNKLLLTLENSSNMRVIGIAYKQGLLATVYSRMQLVAYHPLLKEDFIARYTEMGYLSEEAVLFFYASDGVEDMKGFFDENKSLLREVRENVLAEKRHLLLKTLSLLQEKDKSAVTSDPELMKAVLRVIARTCCDKAMELCLQDKERAFAYACICRKADEDVMAVDKVTYTKNDFFETIMSVIEMR